jgi:hypothetical protein
MRSSPSGGKYQSPPQGRWPRRQSQPRRSSNLSGVVYRALIIGISFVCVFGIASFAEDKVAEGTMRDNVKWLGKQMEIASSFQRGSSAKRLLEFFQRDAGFGIAINAENWRRALRSSDNHGSWPYAATFAMRTCPLIKVDIRFQSGQLEPAPGDRIEWISMPYLRKNKLE